MSNYTKTFSIASALVLFFSSPQSSATQAAAEPIKITTIRGSVMVPESCKNAASTAEENFNNLWSSKLIETMETEKESTEKAEQLFQDRMRNGHIPINRHLVPQGTVAVILDRLDLTGNLLSLFVDCEGKLAYISKRGGMQGETRWYGPFKL